MSFCFFFFAKESTNKKASATDKVKYKKALQKKGKIEREKKASEQKRRDEK